MTRPLSQAVPAGCSVYVVTVGADGRAHVAPTTAVVGHGGIVEIADVGRRTRANLTAGSAVTVVWSTGDPDDHTLIVDGPGIPDDDGCLVRPERAVLHRRGPGNDHDVAGGGACGADCVELAIG
ncbi:hypothetical protein LQ327_18875 [Actinomycetospora endophytica]|uniref:Pyridoxamine 5'-phosphate oxidase n=1 Tax=Actinomycetospora endophytica TaxID=2291215 RepID=A0ABS8PB48_9PSEU|nr:hypothetical protein [Actinomycetospora endophytica]MCD2195438.1 hypothetical protein [Actinomycetospora endophytica]